MRSAICVDDQESILLFLEIALKKIGFTEIYKIKNKTECVEILENVSDVHIAFIDFHIEKYGDGVECAEKIRDRYGNIPIILFTGYEFEKVKEKMSYFDYFIQKPCGFTYLQNICDQFLT